MQILIYCVKTRGKHKGCANAKDLCVAVTEKRLVQDYLMNYYKVRMTKKKEQTSINKTGDEVNM